MKKNTVKLLGDAIPKRTIKTKNVFEYKTTGKKKSYIMGDIHFNDYNQLKKFKSHIQDLHQNIAANK